MNVVCEMGLSSSLSSPVSKSHLDIKICVIEPVLHDHENQMTGSHLIVLIIESDAFTCSSERFQKDFRNVLLHYQISFGVRTFRSSDVRLKLPVLTSGLVNMAAPVV